MAIIKKKIWPEYFDAIVSGKKKYELRLNDFEVNEGDSLILEEWDPETKEYTGRKTEKKVTYVGKFKIDNLFWPEKEIKEKEKLPTVSKNSINKLYEEIKTLKSIESLMSKLYIGFMFLHRKSA